MIEADPARSEKLATQLVRLGVEPIRVADLGEAVDTVKAKQYAFGGVLLPADLPGKSIHKALKSMRRREPILPAMVYGKDPDPAQRKDLRRAGVILALWDGYDESELRFQINRLVAGDTRGAVRESRRAPTHLPIRILVAGREKKGVLQSISQGGCFIESPRASMDGARLRLLFELDEHLLELDGIVAFANVPGNLQRPNLPLGMGVRFLDAPADSTARITHYIESRLTRFEV